MKGACYESVSGPASPPVEQTPTAAASKAFWDVARDMSRSVYCAPDPFARVLRGNAAEPSAPVSPPLRDILRLDPL